MGPAEGGSEDRPYQWRVVDRDSREVVLSGVAPSRELAILEARAKAERLKHRGLIGPMKDDISALREVVQPRTKKTAHPGGPEQPAAMPLAETPPATDEAAAQEPATTPAWSPDPMDLVRSLLPVADSLPFLTETANDLLDRARAEASATDAAILLRDGEVWRVVAGDGLRALEFRCELTGDHWLVATVYQHARAIRVNNTDTVRPQLAGAPLASRKSLIVAPLAGLHALLLVARRDDPPFTENELNGVAELSLAAVPSLTEAIDVRDLARALDRYRELPA